MSTSPSDRKVSLLRRVLTRFVPAELAELAREARVDSLAAGHTLFWFDRADRHVAFLERGSVEIRRPGRGTRLFTMRVVDAPAAIGWSALVDQPHSASVVAGPGGVQFLKVPAVSLMKLFEEHPAKALPVLMSLLRGRGETIRALSDDLEKTRNLVTKDRLWEFLKEEARRGGGVVRLSQKKIADRIGCSPGGLSTALHELVREGRVSRTRGSKTITVVDRFPSDTGA